MSVTIERDITNDEHWQEFSHQWLIRSDTTYLNHGSFGPAPQVVRQARRRWIDALDQQPMDFYVRQLEPALLKARTDLAGFVGSEAQNLVLVENSTYGMNVIASSFPLAAGDSVLLNNHEYGAVYRTWDRACQRQGANIKSVRLPDKFESQDQIVDCLLAGVDDHTKVVVVSHITSATAIIMPLEKICAAFKERGIAVVVDGPHAPAHLDLDLQNLGCDFYTSSCHKWLCASLGTGFLFVAPQWQQHIRPQIKSWGRLLPAMPETWDEEFTWVGTRDPSGFLSISDAIDFLANQVGLENFQARSRYLAGYAEQLFSDEFKTQPIANRSEGWYGSMAHIPMPDGDFSELQKMLWNEYKIEVPIIHFDDKWYLRVSCHLYNNKKQIESLNFAIRKFMI